MKVCICFLRVHTSNVPPHFPHPEPQVSSEILVMNRVPLREGMCICVTALQSLKGAQDIRSAARLGLRLKLEVSLKDILLVALLED